MKHFVLLLFFVSPIFSAFAQFNEGDKFVGGSFGLSINSFDRVSQTKSSDFSINLSPNLGYFINESSAIGLIPQLNFYRNTTSRADMEKQSNNSLSGGIGVFYRKYFTVADNFYLFIEPRFLYNGSIIGENDENYLSLSIAPGAAYRISPNWMVEATLGGLLYSRSFFSSGPNQESTDSRFAFDLITTNSIGIIYFFKKNDQ